MGIQINGQNDTITGIGGTITVATDLNVPGVLTYEDVTNVDSIGIITARSGLHVKTSASRQLEVETDSGDGNLVLKCVAPNDSKNLRNIDIAGQNVSLSTGAFDTTAHAERLVIDSTGRIGVGTNTFNDAAEVMRVQAAQGQSNTLFTIKANSTTGYCALNFGDDDFNEGRIIYQHDDNTMRFRTDDDERVSIGSSEMYMSGFIRTGNRPYMRANVSPSVTFGVDETINSFGSVAQNPNFSSYNNTTGEYTCPIDGFYMATMGITGTNTPSNTTNSLVWLLHTGPGVTSVASYGSNYRESYVTCSSSGVFNCLAGDKIMVRATNITIMASSPRNYFTVTYLG